MQERPAPFSFSGPSLYRQLEAVIIAKGLSLDLPEFGQMNIHPIGEIFELICWLLAGATLVIILGIWILYFVTLQRALNRVSPQNRLMDPCMVWLGIIPVFGQAWSFLIATKIPDSLRNERRARGEDDATDHGKQIGLIQAILAAVATVLFLALVVFPGSELIKLVGCFSFPLGFIHLAFLIGFWLQILKSSNSLLLNDRRKVDLCLARFDDAGNPYPDNPSPDSFKAGIPDHYR